MKAVFADTFYYIALLDEADAYHARAIEFARSYQGLVVTSRWVFVETANALSGSWVRSAVAESFRGLEKSGMVKIAGEGDEYFQSALDLYGARDDKRWSLTDCISFLVMQEEGLQEALTKDHHFAQAGFIPLFADPQ